MTFASRIDECYTPARTLTVLKEADAEIVALQDQLAGQVDTTRTASGSVERRVNYQKKKKAAKKVEKGKRKQL